MRFCLAHRFRKAILFSTYDFRFSSRVLATQLHPKLTKNLLLTDPSRVKTTGEIIQVDFHVPNGCQLIVMYIPLVEYEELKENVRRIESINTVKAAAPTANGNSNVPPTFPFQFKKKLMKRDKSMVFNDIPEEAAGPSTAERPQSVRPNHLPLRFKNITSTDIPESGFCSSITFDEHDSYPQFYNRTSVCSTPMTENKVLHGNILPICAGNVVDEPLVPWDAPIDIAKEADEETTGTIARAVPESLPETAPTSAIADVKAIQANGAFVEYDVERNTVDKPIHKRSQSYTDIREIPFSEDIANFTNEIQLDKSKQLYLDDSDPIEAADDEAQKYRTICDPFYPYFNRSGAPLSWDLFRTYLNRHRKQNFDFLEALADSAINGMLDEMIKYENDSPTPPDKTTVEPVQTAELVERVQPIPTTKPIEKPVEFGGAKPKSRIGLSLPLKCCSSDSSKDRDFIDQGTSSASIFENAGRNRKLAGLQLTPLVSKLSIIAANEERSSGFSSWDATPGVELATPLDNIKLFRRQSSIKQEEADLINFGEKKPSFANIEDDDVVMQRVELFICSQNNMTFYLLLEDNAREKRELIQKMVSILSIGILLAWLHNFELCFI